MTIFTPLSKNRLSWKAPEVTVTSEPEVDFVFSDGTDFVFSSGVDYVFREETSERIPLSWTLPTKNRLSWQN